MRKGAIIKPSGRTTVEFPLDDRYRIATNAWRNTFFAFNEVLGKELGWKKAADLIYKSWGVLGPSDFGFLKKYGLTDKNAAKLSKNMQFELLVEGFDFDVVEETEKRAVLRYLSCPWWHDLKERWQGKVDEECFKASTCNGPGCKAIVINLAKYTNPKLKAQRTKWVAENDPYCEYVLELEE